MVNARSSVVKVWDDEEAERFLRQLGLYVGESAVREAVIGLQRGASKYELWKGKQFQGSWLQHSVASKNTISKIEKLFRSGELAPYLNQLETHEEKPGGVECPDSNDQKTVFKLGEDADILSNVKNLQAILMLEQAKGSMSRHSKELRLEAGRWRDLIQGFHQGDQRFDYFSSEKEFSNPRGGDSLIPTLLGTHLKNDLPTTYQKCRQWQVEVRNYWEAVQGLWLRWLGDVASRVKKEELLFEEANETTLEETHFDWYQINFALTLWREILWDHLIGHPEFPYLGDLFGSVYELKEKVGFYQIYFLNDEIASGTKQWVNRAMVLHQDIYEDQKHLLPEELQRLGLFEQQGRLKNMSADASRSLDIICRGGAIFEPGNCEFCAQLLF